jgi:hypothetical protein
MSMRFSVPVALMAVLVGLSLVSPQALAQSRARIFNVVLGSPVSALPVNEWVNPACGTDGGPPSRVLDGFGDFARCAKETSTGLHEVWFIYDDEWEYIGRAHRDPIDTGRYSANTYYSQPIITSLLIDDGGLVQGYRVVTDPKAPTDVRLNAFVLFAIFKGQFSEGSWECMDLPRDERERPVDGDFLKQDCVMRTATQFLKISGRHLLRPGQDVRDVPRSLEQSEGDFESSARLEVYNLAAVTDEPCCQASASR